MKQARGDSQTSSHFKCTSDKHIHKTLESHILSSHPYFRGILAHDSSYETQSPQNLQVPTQMKFFLHHDPHEGHGVKVWGADRPRSKLQPGHGIANLSMWESLTKIYGRYIIDTSPRKSMEIVTTNILVIIYIQIPMGFSMHKISHISMID
ncbi:hypothetical protein GcC1_205013 [Golovinomyces cichoracearum]|uniref:Uncharacterized protein n=1 Tax=Golovinomyces cichoracearum TaxID=62708 RepID=A0A420HCR2_9PEZI|nr:hypothetical protein GcC1_205013 [Golovinomyces cichoracearum]